MSLHRLLLRRLSSIAASRPIFSLTQTRSYAFSSAEEAAAERRRRKRRLRIEPPLNAIRPPPQQGPPRDPNAPRHLTKGLIQAGRISEVVDLLREMLTKGHGADSLVYNNLISGFIKLENLEKVNELFDELKERCLVYDGVVNSTFMEWHCVLHMENPASPSFKQDLDLFILYGGGEGGASGLMRWFA
ncbi:hypothetical protein LR48_Vigan05g207000 [Vigna angularis]|uniref:Pentatricopeptide repeat-containing protein n=1 Tax=Phaseolus angularis TaxID=3914 RepID=A0A0L9UNL7_PHAAN|nr:hypothetical protein LR48_Vigan05g207000 [Vigna angularis]